MTLPGPITGRKNPGFAPVHSAPRGEEAPEYHAEHRLEIRRSRGGWRQSPRVPAPATTSRETTGAAAGTNPRSASPRGPFISRYSHAAVCLSWVPYRTLTQCIRTSTSGAGTSPRGAVASYTIITTELGPTMRNPGGTLGTSFDQYALCTDRVPWVPTTGARAAADSYPGWGAVARARPSLHSA